jgi:putative SOS response-associated peptidase YedK
MRHLAFAEEGPRCGRFVLSSSPAVIAEIFRAQNVPELLPPRYNVALSQFVVTIRADAEGHRSLGLMRWGLVPSWTRHGSRDARQ